MQAFPLTVLQDSFFLVLYPERKTGVGLTYYLVSKFESRNINTSKYIPSSGHKSLQKPQVCLSKSASTDVAHQNPSESNLVQELYVVLESLNGIMHGFFEENLWRVPLVSILIASSILLLKHLLSLVKHFDNLTLLPPFQSSVHSSSSFFSVSSDNIRKAQNQHQSIRIQREEFFW